MSVFNSTPPKINQYKFIIWLKDNYSFFKKKKLSLLKLNSERDRNYLIFINNKPLYVAKISNSFESKKYLEMQDYVLSSLGFAGSNKLPILFICEDNNLSVLTKKITRRTWNISEVAKSFNLNSCDITDDPQLITEKVNFYKNKLPALINIRTFRDVWHEGTGSDGEPEWSRYLILKKFLINQKLEKELNIIEKTNFKIVENLWKKQLQKL